MNCLRKFPAGALLCSLMAAINGCEYGERVQEPSGSVTPIGAIGVSDSSEFDRELISAKTKNGDPALREQAIKAVLDRYGLVNPSVSAPSLLPGDGASDAPSLGGPAAAKAAWITGASTWNPVRRNFSGGNDIHTFYKNVVVPKNTSLGVAVIGATANVDPVLVAYVKDVGGYDTYTVKVVGFNDDIGSANRNAVITYSNKTLGSQLVTLVAFAYSTSTRGEARVVVNTEGLTESLPNRVIGGLHQYGATALPEAPSNCFPGSTSMTFNSVSGPNLGTALVIDNQAKRGGEILWSATAPQPLVLPWIVNNPYPSFVLIYNSESGILNPNWAQNERPYTWQFIQKDNYSCVH